LQGRQGQQLLRGGEGRPPSGERKNFNGLDVWKIGPARANVRGGRRGEQQSGDPRDMDMPPRIDESNFGRVDNNDDIPF